MSTADLAPFTAHLRDEQPEDAFASVYRVGEQHLVWLGAKHATHTESQTFRLIEEAYRVFTFDTVIVEGCPASWGPNPERLLSSVKKSVALEKQGFQQDGEIVPTIVGAMAQQAVVLCGEPKDSDIKLLVLAAGFAPSDLLGFYTLRTVPQWIREKRVSDASDERLEDLLVDELESNRARLALGQEVLPTVEDWHSWYQRINGKPLGGGFTTEEAGPRPDGPFPTNAIGAAISMARATYLHELVISELRAGKAVLVVYGASHLMMHEPALEASLGSGCRILTDELARSLSDCR